MFYCFNKLDVSLWLEYGIHYVPVQNNRVAQGGPVTAWYVGECETQTRKSASAATFSLSSLWRISYKPITWLHSSVQWRISAFFSFIDSSRQTRTISWKVTKMKRLRSWASAEIFPGGATSTFCLFFSGCKRCNANEPRKKLYSFYTAKKISHESTRSFHIVLKSYSCRAIFEFAKSCRLLSVILIAFAELGFHPISLFLWTIDNWVWIGIKVSTTTFAVLKLVCACFLQFGYQKCFSFS